MSAVGIVEAKAACLGELPRVGQLAVSAQKSWAGDDDASDGSDRLRNQRGVVQMADAHSDVDAFLDEIYDPVQQHEIDADTRVLLQKPRDGGHDMVLTEQNRSCHAQGSCWFHPLGGDQLIRLVQIRHDAPRALQVLAALLGQRESAGRAVQQLDAEVGFKRCEGANDGGQRRFQRIRGRSQTAAIDNGDEDFQGTELIHGRHDCCKKWSSQILRPSFMGMQKRGTIFRSHPPLGVIMPTAKPTNPILFYRHSLSGHAHRVEMFLNMLGLSFTPRDVDLARGEQKLPAFLALNAFGQVPVIDDGGVVVSDSNAILVYLALRYAEPGWLPRDPFGASRVQRWLSVAAGPLAFGAARARVIQLFKLVQDSSEAIERAHALLRVMEHELGGNDFIVGERPTIADLALYSYSAHAPEGNVSLSEYPKVRAWLQRIETLPGFVAMPVSKIGLAA